MREVIASGEIEFEDIQGSVTLASLTQPHLLFVCAGSGFAQAHAMLLSAIHLNHPAKLTLMWAVDSPADFYARDLLETIGPSVSIHLFADRRRDPSNSGMRWLRDQASRITSNDVVLCGSPSFVYAVTDLLTAAGVSEQRLQSDVYAYAPR
jgi:CDP-4-dehydro-6-deoxyglucose reductase, E3